MRYPTISLSDCRKIAEQRIAGRHPPIEPFILWMGRDADLDLEPLERAAKQFGQELDHVPPNADKDRVEGHLSTFLYEALFDVPVEVLDDRGFWRYLSVVFFWDYIVWREEMSFRRETYPKYVDGQTSTEAVLNRMYLRAKAVGTDPMLAAALPKATDFWRSHVIRVRTGSAPALTRALVRRQESNRLATGTLRGYARALNRTWTNVVLHTYSEDEARELLDELHQLSLDGEDRERE